MDVKKKAMTFPHWMIITVKCQTALIHTDNEVWYLRPPFRYVVTSDVVEKLGDQVETKSLLAGSSKFVPLNGRANLAGAKILAARHLDRGLGDLLFMTGVYRYLQHITGNDCKIFAQGLVEKSQVLHGNHDLFSAAPVMGVIEYNQLPAYNFHWMVESVTEYDSEEDQLNVYDAMYRGIHVDPSEVGAEFKRPYVSLTEEDRRAFDSFAYFVFEDRKIDIRRTGYFVVAPLATSSLRVASYHVWIELIKELSKMLPVVVIGQIYDKMPAADMSVNDFKGNLGGNPRIIDMIDRFPIRSSMAVIANAVCSLCLDSGPLYISQALRSPAISLWGTHDPGVRIGYDHEYMELALWNKEACRKSPCYAYEGFPYQSCPLGNSQTICEPLRSISLSKILEKVEVVLRRKPRSIGSFSPAKS